MGIEAEERRLREALRRGYLPPPPVRSLNMAAVKRSDTKPEIALRKALHAAGYRFRKDYLIRFGGVPIRPDIAFTKRRVAVFLDGCFWHGCPQHQQTPATNSQFWAAKLKSNVDRDRRQDRLLEEAGWRVVRIWEHVDVQAALRSVVLALGQQ